MQNSPCKSALSCGHAVRPSTAYYVRQVGIHANRVKASALKKYDLDDFSCFALLFQGFMKLRTIALRHKCPFFFCRSHGKSDVTLMITGLCDSKIIALGQSKKRYDR